MTVIPEIRHQRLESTNLMPIHNEHSLYFTLDQIKHAQFLKSNPLYKMKNNVGNIKYVSPLELRLPFEMFLQSHVNINIFLTQLLFQCSYCRFVHNFWYLFIFFLLLTAFASSILLYVRLNILIIYLRHWKVQFREFLQLCDETVIIGFKSIGTLQWQALQIRVQGHDIS